MNQDDGRTYKWKHFLLSLTVSPQSTPLCFHPKSNLFFRPRSDNSSGRFQVTCQQRWNKNPVDILQGGPPPTSYKWSYNPYKWPYRAYRWVTGATTLIMYHVYNHIYNWWGPTLSNLPLWFISGGAGFLPQTIGQLFDFTMGFPELQRAGEKHNTTNVERIWNLKLVKIPWNSYIYIYTHYHPEV